MELSYKEGSPLMLESTQKLPNLKLLENMQSIRFKS